MKSANRTKQANKAIIDWIMVRGARENNLKDLDLDLPKRKLIVLTGPSGSGKSTLAFDTIFAEGQRRYIESLSAYAKQFVEQLKRPDVESITGLCPSLAIQQKKISQNPRSTVATISEVYDYLRLLYSRVGEVIDPNTGEKLSAQSVGQMTDAVLRLGIGARISVLAIVAERKKGAFAKEIEKFVRLGFVRARIDGLDYELQIGQKLDKNKPHDFEIYIDRLVVKPEANLRLQDAIEKALEFGEGRFKIVVHSENDRILAFSRNLTSSDGSFSIPEMTPRLFSFNSPMGACPECKGMGYLGFEEWEASQDFDERVDDGEELAAEENLPCPLCKGSRLRLESRSVFINNLSIDQIHAMSIREALSAIQSFEFRGNQKLVSAKIIEELGNRLRFLEQVGLDYLNLNRMTKTLSGGEEQRVRLATQMGIHLRGVLYVLDEPSIGLHQLDNDRLIAAMKSLRDMGNTVLVVEHDIDTMRAADEIIDLGPGAGIHGGEIIEQATPREMKRGLTAEFLSGKRKIAVPEARRPLSKRWIKIKSAKVHNLKGIDVNIPLGVFVAVAGVSGSGKSSLILEVLAKSLREEKSVNCEELKGAENIDKLIEVSQSPIGRSPRSNPATYIDLFSGIRDLYSKVPLARQRGYGLGRFSFNVKGGRCEACQGAGESKIQMHFLPNVKVTCETCRGRRYNPATLECLYKGKTIHEVLEMSFEEALEFFEAVPYLRSKIQVVYDVGLGYLKLGQAATTLSGGEAQRIKLAKQLAKRQTGKTLYIMDEPTSGLHHVDVEQLLKVCQRLVDQGNSLIVIEHHLDVIKSADYVIDMGPLGGDRGGEIVGFGTPEELVKLSASHTGRFLKSFLSHGRAARARAS